MAGQEIIERQTSAEVDAASTIGEDLAMLTKARLSALVAVTSLFGYLLAASAHGTFDWWVFCHTVLGTLLAAFGAAVFNQMIEVEADARMERTMGRPLPSRRISKDAAFVIGSLLAALGVLHLAIKVGFVPAGFALATLAVYLFIYTPMKRRSTWNTVAGAVAGALPPLIGWTAGNGGFTAGAAFLFLLLFLWQMPHFLAINWMYRDQYVAGGFVMWSNDDDDGSKTSWLAVVYSLGTLFIPLLPVLSGEAAWWFLIPGIALGAIMVMYSLKFRRDRVRKKARSLFFYTLAYLPLLLIFSLLAWRG